MLPMENFAMWLFRAERLSGVSGDFLEIQDCALEAAMILKFDM